MRHGIIQARKSAMYPYSLKLASVTFCKAPIKATIEINGNANAKNGTAKKFITIPATGTLPNVEETTGYVVR